MDNGQDNALPDRVLVRTQSGFGAFVRSCRIQSSLTQDELARSVGKSRRWLQDVERGRVALSLPAAISLALALGYDLTAEKSKPSSVLDQVFGDLK